MLNLPNPRHVAMSSLVFSNVKMSNVKISFGVSEYVVLYVCFLNLSPFSAQKMFGVCIHPRLGGWFAIRALLVFKDVQMGEELQQKDPPDCVCSQEDRIELLECFNFRWQDWSYRDIIPTEERYSPRQREYFLTPPGQRGALLRQWGYMPEKQSSTNKHLPKDVAC